jgi:hypothetical protein
MQHLLSRAWAESEWFSMPLLALGFSILLVGFVLGYGVRAGFSRRHHGKARRRYEATGSNVDNGKIVRHVSLARRFVGTSWLFPKSAGNIHRETILREQGSPTATGDAIAAQEPTRAEDETRISSDGHALRPLSQVLAVATEVFAQRDAKDDQGVHNVGEMLNSPTEQDEPAVHANSTSERSKTFSEAVERVFEMHSDRIE